MVCLKELVLPNIASSFYHLKLFIDPLQLFITFLIKGCFPWLGLVKNTLYCFFCSVGPHFTPGEDGCQFQNVVFSGFSETWWTGHWTMSQDIQVHLQINVSFNVSLKGGILTMQTSWSSCAGNRMCSTYVSDCKKSGHCSIRWNLQSATLNSNDGQFSLSL